MKKQYPPFPVCTKTIIHFPGPAQQELCANSVGFQRQATFTPIDVPYDFNGVASGIINTVNKGPEGFGKNL